MKLTQIIEEAYLEEIGIETTDSDKSFLKGVLTAGTLAALLGSPEAAEATKEALHGAADNIGDFFHNALGSGEEHVGYAAHATYATGQNNLASILAQQGYYKDQETGAWINPNTHQVYFNPTKPMNADRLSNILDTAKLKANYPGLYFISPTLANGADFAENHPILTGAGAAGAVAGGTALYRQSKSTLSSILSKAKT